MRSDIEDSVGDTLAETEVEVTGEATDADKAIPVRIVEPVVVAELGNMSWVPFTQRVAADSGVDGGPRSLLNKDAARVRATILNSGATPLAIGLPSLASSASNGFVLLAGASETLHTKDEVFIRNLSDSIDGEVSVSAEYRDGG